MHHQGIQTKVTNEYDIAKRFELEKPEAKKLVRQFNESAAIAFLPPLRDKIKSIVERFSISVSSNVYSFFNGVP